jgi:alkanesulfonate monooxygenase SsuD/methylene tetrahydromethanopterin reductase-like flavin-dependent oxidoreductase (luciferase family)
VAAETDDEARFLATSQQMSFADLARGARRVLQPPIEDIDQYWSPPEQARASEMLACSVVGGADTVRRGVEAFLARTHADELMVVSDLFDFTKRLRSFELIADACKRS